MNSRPTSQKSGLQHQDRVDLGDEDDRQQLHNSGFSIKMTGPVMVPKHGLGWGPVWLEVGTSENATWRFESGFVNYTTFILNSVGWCENWRERQHMLFHIANACFLISYAAPSNRTGLVIMHSLLILGFLLFSGWAWNVVCAPDVFTWNISLMFLNLFQLFYIVYLMRPVKFDPELEDAYHTLFQPFKVSRLTFKKLVSAEFAQIASLHAGEAYAMQNLTRTDRLGLLLTGKANVLSGQQFLHPILPCEFLDSPEFESSRANIDEKFKVSIVAATACRYLYWQRSSLEYLFVKETYLATVMTTLVAKDIATKLYAMNNKIITERGAHLDIRLPSITASLNLVTRNTKEAMKKSQNPQKGDKIFNTEANQPLNGFISDMEPLKEIPSNEDIESWLESSSKYHSCELLDD